MISNQVLQNTLEGLKEISRTEFCVIDTDGKVLASTFSDFEIQPADIQAFVCRDVPMAHPQSTSHESLTIAINLRKAANRLPYMNAERMAAFPLPRTHRCPRILTQV